MEKNQQKALMLLVAILCFIIVFEASSIIAIEPSGSSVTEERTETAPADTAGSHEAQAGNVTELNIVGYSVTQSWTGYFGNVTGTIHLGDANDNTFYNWTQVNPQGEVYASMNQSITWSNVQCFNFSATGNYSGYATETPGSTSLFGTNLTQLESQFNIVSDDVDGVDETFTLSGAGTHDLFYTANLEFAEGECLNTRIFGDTGEGTNDEFEEALLYEPTTSSVIFASILEESNVLGFDALDHDFEMVVLEDGHGTDTETTSYYFFMEIE